MLFLALSALLAVPALAISPVTVKGSKLFIDGNQWYMKGVAYQLTNSDPLADPDQCKLDAALMKTLGANSIRVYHVDAAANHDSCMQTFADAGIYPWIDLDTFDTYIISSQNGQPSWTQSQFDSFAKVMDAFAKYDNVAGFFVANELLVDPATSVAAPYVKAAARDMKAYRDSKNYRNFPVGYTAADVSVLRPMLQNYLACGSKPEDAIDVYGLNAYEWCGHNTFENSGYAGLQQNASEYNIPIFFSETGCIVSGPRLFEDQAAILGNQMSGTWSGAIIYEWINEANSYGLVNYGPPASAGPPNSLVIDGFTRRGTPTPIQPDFSNLSKQWATLQPSGTQSAAYNPSLSAPPCPAYTSGQWLVDPNAALPTLGQAAYAAHSAAPEATGTTGSGTTTGSAAAAAAATTAASGSAAGSSTGTGTNTAAAAAGASTTTTHSSSGAAASPAPTKASYAAWLAAPLVVAFF